MEAERDALLKTLNDLDLQLQEHNKSDNDCQQEKLALLHKYNAVKDAAQVVVGEVANLNGNTISAQHQAFNLPLK